MDDKDEAIYKFIFHENESRQENVEMIQQMSQKDNDISDLIRQIR